jgi:hypothetical protein
MAQDAPLLDAFRALHPAAPDGLAALLGEVLATSAAAWPEVALPPAAFAQHLALHTPGGEEPEAWLKTLRGPELYLACACAAGDARAMALCDAQSGPEVDQTLRRMDLPPATIESDAARLKKAIENETRFGIGAAFKNRRDHPVMDEDWSVTETTRQHKDKAWAQLGTSGSGNHFVEFGEFTVENKELGIEPGKYLALLSHSGSRGTGAQVCDYYSRVARKKHTDLPKELSFLAWLDLDSADGQE